MGFVYEFVLLFLLFSHLMLVVLGGGGDGKNEYKGEGDECPSSFSCGYLGNNTFPFTTTQRPHCGLLPIYNCDDDDDDPKKPKMIQLQDKGKWFVVIHLSSKAFVFRDVRLYELLQSRSCEVFRYNYTLPPTTNFHFVSLRITASETLFRCDHTLHVSPPTSFHNYTKCRDYDLYYNPLISADNINRSSVGALASCTTVQLPIKDVADAVDPFTFMTADILTQVNITDECANCYYKKRGRCQLDSRERFCCASNGMLKQKSLKHKHT